MTGRLRTDAEEARRRETGEKGRTYGQSGGWERNEDEKKMVAALEKVAKEVGTEHVTAVAIAYVMQKTPYVFPIIGGRKVEHLMANIEALKIALSDEQIKYLESILPFDPGFPGKILVSDALYLGDSGLSGLLRETAHMFQICCEQRQCRICTHWRSLFGLRKSEYYFLVRDSCKSIMQSQHETLKAC